MVSNSMIRSSYRKDYTEVREKLVGNIVGGMTDVFPISFSPDNKTTILFPTFFSSTVKHPLLL